MSVVISNYGVLGPFKQVQVVGEKLVCDSTVYPLHLIGVYSVSADDSLAPTTPHPDVVPVDAQLAAIEAALDAHLDAVAQQYRFADRTRLALRAAYPNVWQALGLAFGTWMDTCNAMAAQGMQDFLDGKIALQTPEEVIAQLPEFVAP